MQFILQTSIVLLGLYELAKSFFAFIGLVDHAEDLMMHDAVFLEAVPPALLVPSAVVVAAAGEVEEMPRTDRSTNP